DGKTYDGVHLEERGGESQAEDWFGARWWIKNSALEKYSMITQVKNRATGEIMYSGYDLKSHAANGYSVNTGVYPLKRIEPITTILLSDNTIPDTQSYLNKLSGDNLIYIPVEKTQNNYDIETLSPTIYWLNNSKGLIPNRYTVLGSPINDIPIQVFGAAIMKKAFVNNQEVKVREKELYEIPIFNNKSYSQIVSRPYFEDPMDRGEEYKKWCGAIYGLQIIGETNTNKEDPKQVIHPQLSLFTDLSYIPITLTKRKTLPDGSQYFSGRSKFFQNFIDLFNKKSEVKENRIDTEPAMLSPKMQRWTYMIDGTHQLTIDGAMIDMDKLNSDQDFEIRLNTIMTSETYYKLDIDDIINPNYPISKSSLELTSSDSRNFPYSTESYYNWLATNQATLNTSRANIEMQNRWKWEDYGINAAQGVAGMIGNFVGTAATGGSLGGPLGIAGAIGGFALQKGMSALKLWIGTERRKEKWQLDMNKSLQNAYRSPSQMSLTGIGTGSLSYASWASADFSYESMFRTFEANDFDKNKVWQQIAWYGYPFASTAKFNDYDNRKNFNYFEMDTSIKSVAINNTVREYALKENPLFAQQEFIEWFKNKISDGIRLFKKDWDGSMDADSELVRTNVENDIPDFDE
ncbi:MAG: hypothetical protein HUJ52_03190, partial [Malacoplasma sp.]|nr:hypothetical protein [Malacoplasma sp.]